MTSDFAEWLKRLDIRYKSAMISTFIFGIISQGMGLFNKLSVHDDVMYYGVGATYTSGRWMLHILKRLEEKFYGDGHYSLPAFNGFLAIFLIGLSVCLLIRLLDIRSMFFCIFISGIMVSFPVITCLFAFVFTIHFYMIALFFGLLGACFVCRSEKWYVWMAGIVLMGASTGIYQAFYPLTITAVLFFMIDTVVKSDDVRSMLRKTVTAGAGGLLAMVFYFAANKMYLAAHHAVLSDYKGVNNMGKSSLREYLSRAKDAYEEFFFPEKIGSKYFMYPGRISLLYKVCLVLSIVLCIILFVRVLRRSRIHALLLVLLLAVIPLAVNFIDVMAGRKEVHSLMVYAQVLPFVFLIWAVENVHFEKRLPQRVITAVAAVIASALLVMYCRVDNKCYLKAIFAQQEAISYLTTLITQIKETEGYKDEYPVAFVNAKHISDTSVKPGDDGALSDITYNTYRFDVIGYINSYSWLKFMQQWTGYAPTVVEGFDELEEVKKMPSYPDDGSIQIIDDTVVVKF